MCNFIPYKNKVFFEIGQNPSNLLHELSRKEFLEFSVINDGDDTNPYYYIINSSLISDSDRDATIHSKLKTISHLFKGAIRLSGINVTSSSIRVTKVLKDKNPVRLPNYDEVPFNSSILAQTKAEFKHKDIKILKSLYLGVSDEIHFRMLLFASDRFDYVDMYKIYEVLNETQNKSFFTEFNSDLDKFKCSANNFTATGFASRHGKGIANPNQINSIQAKFISIEESRELFQKMYAKVLVNANI